MQFLNEEFQFIDKGYFRPLSERNTLACSLFQPATISQLQRDIDVNLNQLVDCGLVSHLS